jgi:flagellar hook-associated protein 3 FlgL
MISSVSYGEGALGIVVSDAKQVRTTLDTLTEQSATGLVAPTYGGMSPSAASTSLSLQPQLAQQQAVMTGINTVQGRMDVAQAALSQISTIASNFHAQIASLNVLDPSEVDSVAGSARDALAQVADLVDSTDGDVYVFAGQDTDNPPIPDPGGIATGAFGTAITAAVAGLTTNGAAATIASTLQIAGTGSGSVSPFSPSINAGTTAAPTVALGDGRLVAVGIVAGENAAVTSQGTSTTGSYLRDILRGLATLGALSSSQLTADPQNFQTLLADTSNSLEGGIIALNQDAGVLGNRESELTQTNTVLTATSTALQTQIGNVQDVDMASTLSKLTQVQTQLQASYQVIASLQSLSLVKFLS